MDQNINSGIGVAEKMKDMGDGTHARVVYLGGVTAADGADATFGAKADAPATNDTGAFSFMALFKRLLSFVARETYSAVTITSVATNATGANFNAFAALACSSLDIVNTTGTDIEYRRGGAGSTIVVPTGTSRLVQGITNANAISLRRVDQGATVVTVAAEAFAV